VLWIAALSAMNGHGLEACFGWSGHTSRVYEVATAERPRRIFDRRKPPVLRLLVVTTRRVGGCALAAVVGLAASAWANPFTTKVADSPEARRLEPATPEVIVGRSQGAPRVLKLRFYADRDYRAVTLRWQERARAWLDVLNRVVTPGLGVRFEAESFRRWDRQSSNGGLEPILAELVQKDGAGDVDLVVGLVSALPLVTASLHEIGMARELGKHFVLRAMADAEEARALDRYLGGVDRLEREALYSRRKWHKEMAVFLHEWAHTLGAPHSSEEQDFMNVTYSHQMRRFSAAGISLLGVALGCRAAEREKGSLDWRPLLAFLETTTDASWYTRDREAEIAWLRKNPQQAREVSPEENREATAWNEAVRLLEAAEEQRKAGEAGGALLSVDQAAEQAQPLSAGGPVWLAVAQSYLRLRALTRAAQAIDKAGTGDAVATTAEHIKRAQRMYGLGKVAPDREPEYTRAFDEIGEALGADLPRARSLLERALTAFPAAPGLTMLACEARLRAGRGAQAEKQCVAALDGAPDLPRAHYLLGLIRLNGGKRDAALDELKRAMTLDPDDPAPWSTLADLYRMTRRRDERAALAEDYQKRFGKPLP
jgi:tetratricopeptide (TPR) repeat protein